MNLSKLNWHKQHHANYPIPIFSLEDLLSGKQIKKFKIAVSEIGFLYIKDYGISESEHEYMINTTLNFFNSSEEKKKNMVVDMPEIRRGYTKLEGDNTAKVMNMGTYTDYSIKYSMGLSNNVFPNNNFQKVWNHFFYRIHGVAQKLGNLMVHVMNVPYENLEDILIGDPLLRFLYYPDPTESRCSETEPLRMAPHYDLSLITLLYQTPCPNSLVSLQAKVGNDYVDIPAIKDTLVVNFGTILTLISEGKIKSTIHRVVSPASHQRLGSNRTSTVFFLRPTPDFIVPTAKAKEYGLDLCFTSDQITFKDWISSNYKVLKNS